MGANEFYLTQSGFTEKVMQACCMINANRVYTGNTVEPVGDDLNRPAFSEDWYYSLIVGMLDLCPSKNSP